jgi:hypothetical protein
MKKRRVDLRADVEGTVHLHVFKDDKMVDDVPIENPAEVMMII